MIERIVRGKTQQQILTSDVALQFEFFLLTVVGDIGEQTHDGSNAMVKQISLGSCDSQICITNLLDATNFANDVLRPKKKHCRTCLELVQPWTP